VTPYDQKEYMEGEDNTAIKVRKPELRKISFLEILVFTE
jgi:hypothetical protein